MKLNTIKINRLQTEHNKNKERIDRLQDRNSKIEEQVTELENTDIIGLVRSVGLTPEELADFLREANGTIPGLDLSDADMDEDSSEEEDEEREYD